MKAAHCRGDRATRRRARDRGRGSGKSAALARLVTLTDPEFRSHYAEQVALIPAELMPPEEAVDVAVLATGKNATQIMTQICQAAGAWTRRIPRPHR